MISNAQYVLIKSSLQVVDKVTTRDEQRCLNVSIAEVALEGTAAKDLGREVALRYNAKTLENTANQGPLSSSSKELSRLLSVDGASKALLAKARALQNTVKVLGRNLAESREIKRSLKRIR